MVRIEYFEHVQRIRTLAYPGPFHTWGREARDHLRDLVQKGPVTVRIIEKDKYKRSVAEVWKDAANANLKMVRTGKAAVYWRHCNSLTYGLAEKSDQLTREYGGRRDYTRHRGNTAIEPLPSRGRLAPTAKLAEPSVLDLLPAVVFPPPSDDPLPLGFELRRSF